MCKICFGGVTDPPLHKHTPVLFLLSVFLLYCHIFSMTDWKLMGTHVHIESHKSHAGYRMPHHACRIPHIWNLSFIGGFFISFAEPTLFVYIILCRLPASGIFFCAPLSLFVCVSVYLYVKASLFCTDRERGRERERERDTHKHRKRARERERERERKSNNGHIQRSRE